MGTAGLPILDTALKVTNGWLAEMMETLGPDRHIAWDVLGSVLRIVRDRVPINLAAHLGAQLPLLVRGTYYDQWRPSEEPAKWRSQEEFLPIVSDSLAGTRPINPKDAARSVFMVLNHHVQPGQVGKVREALPEDVRRLWPESNA